MIEAVTERGQIALARQSLISTTQMWPFKKLLNLQVPDDLMSVIHYYEDSCVMNCCGVSALNLEVQRAIDGMMDFGWDTAVTALAQLDAMIESVKVHQGPVFSDQNGFGEHWDRNEDAQAFLENVRASLLAAIDTPGISGRRTKMSRARDASGR